MCELAEVVNARSLPRPAGLSSTFLLLTADHQAERKLLPGGRGGVQGPCREHLPPFVPPLPSCVPSSACPGNLCAHCVQGSQPPGPGSWRSLKGRGAWRARPETLWRARPEATPAAGWKVRALLAHRTPEAPGDVCPSLQALSMARKKPGLWRGPFQAAPPPALSPALSQGFLLLPPSHLQADVLTLCHVARSPQGGP